jgi:PAS domain-containing protein
MKKKVDIKLLRPRTKAQKELKNSPEHFKRIVKFNEALRKKAEDALWESSQMLKLVLNNMPSFVFWKDLNSVYLGCNYLFASNAGLKSSEEIVGKTDYDLPWKDTEAEGYRTDDREVMNTGKAKLNYEETQFTADGRTT